MGAQDVEPSETSEPALLRFVGQRMTLWQHPSGTTAGALHPGKLSYGRRIVVSFFVGAWIHSTKIMKMYEIELKVCKNCVFKIEFAMNFHTKCSKIG